MTMLDDIEKVLITEEQIQTRIRGLADELNARYTDADVPLLVCILKGAVVFLSDLVRHLNFRHEMDFMVVSSYGSGTRSSGIVRILLDLEANIEGRHVIIVEDIIDTGHTLNYILHNLETRHPASIRIATLLNKPSRREIHNIPVDFVGFEIPDEFVLGFGLDYAEQYRNLPFIGVLKPEVYTHVND